MLRKISLAVLTAAMAAAPGLMAQGGTSTPTTGGGTTTPAPSVPGGTTGGNTGTAPNTGRLPTIPSNTGNSPTTNPFPSDMPRPIYISGRVMMEDGTPPPESLLIERVCNGQPKPEGYTDSKGRFSFELGRNQMVMADASTSGGGFDSERGGSSSRTPGMPGSGGVSERSLAGCEIRAALVGYRSTSVMLAGRRMLDNPEIGTLLLKRMANVEGFTYSATTGMAPKEAKKAYDKGLDLVKKKKPLEAYKEFEKATAAYPKFSAAWYELGQIQISQNKMEDARKSYELSIAADAKFVKPYLPLLGMALQKGNWEEVAQISAKTVKLNPYEYPQAFFYNALANLNLKNLDEAEKSALSAQKLDERGRMPRIRYVLGIVQAQKSDFKAASENLKAYIASPGATDLDTVKKQLSEIEKLMGEQQETATATEPVAVEPKP